MTCAPSHLTKPEKKINKKITGRPREHDRDQIALDLIEWARKEDSINLCKFCALYDPIIPPSKITIWAKECDNFRKAYESAKLFLGFRREEWLNQEFLHVKGYDLNAETYDYFLKDEKRNKAEFESQLHIKENNNLKSPLDEMHALQHQLMLVKAELAGYKEANGSNK